MEPTCTRIDCQHSVCLVKRAAHNFAGWKKTPSRNGGLKAPKCSCGWLGHATSSATEGKAQHANHQAGA